MGSAGTGGFAPRLRLRGREAMPALYALGYFVSTCPEGYSRSARAAEEGIALCQEVDLLQHVETHFHLEVGCDAHVPNMSSTALRVSYKPINPRGRSTPFDP